ncbi:MAG: long-chain fatty acid--CoA ligase, partial [Sphingomonadaceae bacterium]|nr:long-chain fatty acid--CoA ligase [Sphingomonadaceae bacterium]
CCAPMVGGGAITFMERFDPHGILAAIDRGQVHCLLGVPTMLQLMTELPAFEATDFSRVRLICWGGAALPQNVLARLRAKDCPLGVTYGMSEVPGSITMSAPGARDDELTRTVGRPTVGLDLRVVADDGHVCAKGEEGEVRLKHPSVLHAYYRRPAATEEAFDAEGYFRTGDVGVLDDDGNLRLVGRKKEMFKSGGYNVYPREIEVCLEQHPEVALAAVIGVPDPLYQEVGHAYVIPGPGATQDGLAGRLAEWCRERLANYKRPKRITVSADLPLLPVGKVDKVELKRRHAAG